MNAEKNKRIAVINGPNLNLLGHRETGIYGEMTLESINEEIKKKAESAGLGVDFFQDNSEGSIVDIIHGLIRKVDLIIINAGAYTHTSIAILDALKGVQVPFIEVHLSNIYKREAFRKKSYLAGAAIGQIAGFGMHSYLLAVDAAAVILKKDRVQGGDHV